MYLVSPSHAFQSTEGICFLRRDRQNGFRWESSFGICKNNLLRRIGWVSRPPFRGSRPSKRSTSATPQLNISTPAAGKGTPNLDAPQWRTRVEPQDTTQNRAAAAGNPIHQQVPCDNRRQALVSPAHGADAHEDRIPHGRSLRVLLPARHLTVPSPPPRPLAEVVGTNEEPKPNKAE